MNAWARRMSTPDPKMLVQQWRQPAPHGCCRPCDDSTQLVWHPCQGCVRPCMSHLPHTGARYPFGCARHWRMPYAQGCVRARVHRRHLHATSLTSCQAPDIHHTLWHHTGCMHHHQEGCWASPRFPQHHRHQATLPWMPTILLVCKSNTRPAQHASAPSQSTSP